MKTLFYALMLASLVFGQFAPPVFQGADATGTATPTVSPSTVDTATLAERSTPTATGTPTSTATMTPIPSETGSITPTETSAVSETPTVSTPDSSTTPTATATQTGPALILEATPETLNAGKTIMIYWFIEGISLEERSLSIQIVLPPGVLPSKDGAGTFDPENSLLTIPVEQTEGQVLVETAGVSEDVILNAALLDGEQNILTSTVLVIPLHEQFELGRQGGEIIALDGKLKVKFPSDALTGQSVIEIGAPAGDDIPDYSLSGKPFEIKAKKKVDGEKLEQFTKEIEFEVKLDDFDIPPGLEHDVYLYWYNPKSKAWEGILSAVNPETKILRAKTNHFSVFDIGINNWQATRMPTVDSFQVSGFTGAATFSLPIEVPPGPGGLQPDLALSYNSQVVDQATSLTQPSWVGMGWSLETGSIIRDKHSTSRGSVDTFLLSAGGMSTRVAIDANGIYRPLDENFARVVFYPDANTWTVWDKQGNTYFFEDQARMAYLVDGQIVESYTYQWSLTKVRNLFGKELAYTYFHETKVVGGTTTSTAVYPDTILYPNGRYRIRFEREARYDYPRWWDTDGIYHSYQRSRLKNVYVEQKNDSNQWVQVRRYSFTYAADNESTNIVFPGTKFTDINGNDHRLTTLRSVRQYGKVDTVAYPAYTFTYGDNLHLSQADNGYGGGVKFDYDTNPAQMLYQPWSYNPYSRPTYAKAINFGGEPRCYDDTWSAWSGTIGCYEGAFVVNNGIAQSSAGADYLRPGGVYKVSVTHDPVPAGVTVQAGVYVGKYDFFGASGFTFVLPPEDGVSSALPKIWVSGGGAIIRTYRLELLPTFYRVHRKTLFDGRGHEYTYTYSYDGAAVNDASTSASVSAAGYCDRAPCPEYIERYSEFRGHAKVTEYWPDGRKVITTFWQTDDLKGRSKEVQLNDPMDFELSRTKYTYSSTERTLYSYLSDKYLKGYTVFQTAQETWTNGSTQQLSGGTRSEYYYDESAYIPAANGCQNGYGNLTRQVDKFWNNATWQTHRTSETYYCPKETVNPYGVGGNSSAVYLVSLPVKVKIYDGANALKGLVINLYDGVTGNHMVQPSLGKLTAVRTLSKDGTSYSQMDYRYDEWGNQTDTVTYSEYGHWDTNPLTTEALAVVTEYDPAYHTYPTRQTNYFNYIAYESSLYDPSALVTTWGYDYNLGVPTIETDPNGAVTSAEYDSLGRITTLIRPGDSSASPTLQMSYGDAIPFKTTILQKLNASTSYSLQRTYDGLGRAYESLVNGSILTKTEYDGLNRVISQSTPHTSGETAYYTTTTYNITAHSVKVTAPDGTSVTTITDGLQTTVIEPDANGGTHSTVTRKDAWGRMQSVTPPTGPAVSYTYDVFDRLLTASSGGALTAITYDYAGRKNSMTDPDMGDWTYSYDAAGNLLSQTDARGCQLSLDYDAFSRLTSKTSSGACGTQVSMSYTYDTGANGKGRRTEARNVVDNIVSSWTYDARGRAASETTMGYTTFYSYNSADLPTSMTYPDGETVYNTYDARMLLDTVIGSSTYVYDSVYDSAGRILTRGLGQNNQTGFAPAGGPKVLSSPSQQSGQIFSDVPAGYWAKAQIEGLYNLSIVSPCATNPLRYCPDTNLTRAEVARDLLRAKYGGFYNPPTPSSQRFADVPPSHWAYKWIDKFAADGITGGCGGGNYCPNNSITRAEMVIFLLRVKHGAGYSPPAASHYFADMNGHWAEAWADQAYREGITSGCGGGNFCPSGTVTRASEAMFIEATFHLIPPPATNTPSPTLTFTPSPTPTVTVPLGARLTQSFSYYLWDQQGGRLQSLTAAGTAPFQSFSYTYDPAGNVETITDAFGPGGTQTQSFGYDALNRLVSASASGGTSGTYSESYTYNGTTGNLASKAGVSYTYDAAHKHAVASLSNGNTYQYEANGNMTTRTVAGQSYTLGYDAENHLVSVTGPSLTALFSYDADGKRVKSTINGVTTTFVGGHYEVSGSTVTKYYFAGASRIAMRTSGSLYFVLGDHLGSTSSVVTASGQEVAKSLYTAWGETRFTSGTLPTKYTYTGQYSNMLDFGLMYYNARWYDPYITQFSQPDSIIPDPGNPQSLNRYTYTLNNPVRYTDPTGHWVDPGCGSGEGCDLPAPPPGGGESGGSGNQVGNLPTYGNGLIGPPAPTYVPNTLIGATVICDLSLRKCYYLNRNLYEQVWVNVPCESAHLYPKTYSDYEGSYLPVIGLGVDAIGIIADGASIVVAFGGPPGILVSSGIEAGASAIEISWVSYLASTGDYNELVNTSSAMMMDQSTTVLLNSEEVVPYAGFFASLVSASQNMQYIRNNTVWYPAIATTYTGFPPPIP